MTYMDEITILKRLEAFVSSGWRVEIPRHEYNGYNVRFSMGGKEVLGFAQTSLYGALLDAMSKTNYSPALLESVSPQS